MKLRLIITVLFLELIALGLLIFVHLSENMHKIVEHILIILVMGTVGWILCGVVVLFYRRFLNRIRSNRPGSASRALLTQALFLYRFLIFAIIVVTLALILLTFPYIRGVGVGILGSAGIVGIALGIAARPILLNLMAGFQIAINKTINIGDLIVVDGETARVESIHLTHIIIQTWDLRRVIIPISRFIDQSFQNWDIADPELIGTVFIYCDYQMPVETLRQKTGQILAECPYWNKKSWKLHVTDCKENTIEIRIIASAKDANDAFELRAYLREKLIAFINAEHTHALPTLRTRELSRPLVS